MKHQPIGWASWIWSTENYEWITDAPANYTSRLEQHSLQHH